VFYVYRGYYTMANTTTSAPTTTDLPMVACVAPWQHDPTLIIQEPYFWAFSIAFYVAFTFIFMLTAQVICDCCCARHLECFRLHPRKRRTTIQDDPEIVTWLSQTGLASNFARWRQRRRLHLSNKEMRSAEAGQETNKLQSAARHKQPPPQTPKNSKKKQQDKSKWPSLSVDSARYTISDDSTPIAELDEFVFQRNSLSDMPLSPALPSEDPPSSSYTAEKGLLPPLDHDEQEEVLEFDT
jgi:hypothetical protein